MQRSINQFNDHNQEELDGVYTRPTLDHYIINKYWNFLTKDLSAEEVADMEKARQDLERYEKLYRIFEYGCDLSAAMVTLDTRVGNNNPSVPLTVYRKVTILKFISLIS